MTAEEKSNTDGQNPNKTNTEQHYTMGIAGHIDHGKTTLTKALTGKSTDRLKEEQERNISIEVGYASFPLSNGKNVGVVDVPGHERFIRQMVAGVAGIDLVLLVIAADEGVMPQTKEHLDILNLLGVNKGLIVLTKVGLVDEEFLELVREQVAEETAHTFLANSPILETDSVSGEGIDNLKQEIERTVATISSRPVQGIARFPVDRVFSKKGFGTVVTGTLYQGQLSVGDELDVLPGSQKVKIRHLQVHDNSKEAVYAGQRVAANLTGIDKEHIHRGHVLVTPDAVQSTQRLDIEFHMLKDLDFSLKQRSEVRLHLGTSEVMGRIIFFDRNECQPGSICFAQLELNEPVTTLFEDRFILRRPTPMTTLGGGTVIDPYAEKHRFSPETIEHLAAKKEGDLASRAHYFLTQEGVQTLPDLTHQLGVSLADWQAELPNDQDYKDNGLKRIQGEAEGITLICTTQDWRNKWESIQGELQDHHQRYPLREGMARKHVQAHHFAHTNAVQWNVILKQAESENLIKVNNETVSHPRFKATLRPQDRQIWEKIKHELDRSGIESPPWPELLPNDIPEQTGKDLQHWLIRHGELIPLNTDQERFMTREAFEKARQTLRKATGETFTIQDARQAFDTSRKYLIPFLEALDRQEYTVFHAQQRRWKKK